MQGRHRVGNKAAVERIWHTQDSHGQILPWLSGKSPCNLLSCSLSGSARAQRSRVRCQDLGSEGYRVQSEDGRMVDETVKARIWLWLSYMCNAVGLKGYRVQGEDGRAVDERAHLV